MSLDRIQQGSSGPIQVTLLAGSVPTNPSPDTATVTITRADGTAVVTAQNATPGGTGIFTYPLTPAQTAQLDTLTATWTFTSGGQSQSRQTRHEVVGGFLVSLQDLAGKLTGKTDADLAAIRVKLEQRLEKALGYACVPRYALETRYARGGQVTTRLPLRAVRSVSVNGIAYSAGQISSLILQSWGVCLHVRGPVAIGYEHGQDAPDDDITEAMLLLADEMFGTNAVDQWVVRQEADSMAVQYSIPSTGGQFIGARLNQIIAANALPAIA